MADREIRIAGDEILVLTGREQGYRVRSGEAALFVVELDDERTPDRTPALHRRRGNGRSLSRHVVRIQRHDATR